MLGVTAQAGVVSTVDDASPIAAANVASTLSGKHFAFAPVSTSSNYKKWWMGGNKSASGTELTKARLFTLEASGSGYKFKRYSDGYYLNDNASFDTSGAELTLVDYSGNTVDSGNTLWTSTYYTQVFNGSGYLNINNDAFSGGRGGWATYAFFGPLNVVTVVCKYGEEQLQSNDYIVTEGTEFAAPEIADYTCSEAAQTISADGTITFNYTVASKVNITYNYYYNSEKLYSETIEETVGNSPTKNLPAYVDGAGYPTTVPSADASYDITCTYNSSAPFTAGKYYQIYISGGGPNWYWNTKYKTSTKASADADADALGRVSSSQYSNLLNTSPDQEYYLNFVWQITGDWHNGYEIINQADVTNKYVAAPSASPANNTTVAMANASSELTKFLLTQNSSGSYFSVLNGSNHIAHTSSNNQCFNFWNGSGTTYSAMMIHCVEQVKYEYTIVVEGADGYDGGITFDGANYLGGTTLGTFKTVSADNIEAINLSSEGLYAGEPVIDTENNTITVTYSEQVGTYHVVSTGATENGGVTYEGENHAAGTSFEAAPGLTENAFTAMNVEGYKASGITVTENSENDYNVTVTYIVDWTTVDWPVNIPAEYTMSVAENVATSVTPVTEASDNDHWYLVVNRRIQNANYFDAGKETPVYADGTSVKRAVSGYDRSYFNGKDANENVKYLVRFIKTGDTDIYGMQFANGNYIYASSSNQSTQLSAGDTKAAWAFYATNNNSNGLFGWNQYTKAGSRVDNNGAGGSVVLWSSGENTSTTKNSNNIWYVYEVTLTPFDIATARTTLKAKYASYNFGEGPGKYSYVGTGDTFNEAVEACTTRAEIEALDASVAINIPAKNKFYAFKSVTRDKYIDQESENSAQMTLTSDKSAACYFYYSEEGFLINYATGLGTTNTNWSASLSDTKNIITFEESTIDQGVGEYVIRSNYASGGQLMYAQESVIDRNREDHANCAWTIEEVTTLPLTLSNVNDVYYSTIYLPVAATVNGAEVYYVGESRKGVESHLGTYEVEDAKIAANNGYIICGTSDAITISLDDPTPTVTESGLTGKLAKEETSDETVRVFSKKNDAERVGFYKLPSGTTTLKAFRAFYQAADASVAAYELDFEGTTGIIANMLNKKTVEGAYDLQGRKVNNAVRGGLYIIDGKKVIK